MNFENKLKELGVLFDEKFEELDMKTSLILNAINRLPGGSSFSPADNPNTIGWFELAAASDQTLDGTKVLGVANRISNPAMTLTNTTGAGEPLTGDLLNGVDALDFTATDAFMLLSEVPADTVWNFFVGCNVELGTNISYLGLPSTTYLPLARNSLSTEEARLLNVDISNDVTLLFDDESTQSIVTNLDSQQKAYVSSMFSMLGIPSRASAYDLRLGKGAYAAQGPMTRLVIVEGAMTADEISDMQGYFAAQDNW